MCNLYDSQIEYRPSNLRSKCYLFIDVRISDKGFEVTNTPLVWTKEEEKFTINAKEKSWMRVRKETNRMRWKK